ncbi:MAG: thioesterase domain-containing protein, partial [Polyangiaceae bacterium]
TGVSLPVASLLAAPTVEQLAARVRAELAVQGRGRPGRPPDAHLVCFRSEGARPPLFCVHGAGGNVINLHDLARQLPPDRPFYGFQARGVEGHAQPHGTIEEMADAYLTELRSVQPAGPYYLSGYCGGALVAYEIALRLRSEGATVAFLGIIDLHRPGLARASTRLQNWSRAVLRHGPARLVGRAGRKLGATVEDSLSALRIRYHLARGDRIPFELRERWLTAAFLQAALRYPLRPYPGKLTVFRSRDGNRGENGEPLFRDPGPELGWAVLAPGGVEAHEAPGDHRSLVSSPNAEVLAVALEECLRRAETSPAAS